MQWKSAPWIKSLKLCIAIALERISLYPHFRILHKFCTTNKLNEKSIFKDLFSFQKLVQNPVDSKHDARSGRRIFRDTFNPEQQFRVKVPNHPGAHLHVRSDSYLQFFLMRHKYRTTRKDWKLQSKVFSPEINPESGSFKVWWNILLLSRSIKCGYTEERILPDTFRNGRFESIHDSIRNTSREAKDSRIVILGSWAEVTEFLWFEN